MNFICGFRTAYHLESFPRLWDELMEFACTEILTRIIPTPVGWTPNSLWCIPTAPNHSHACGMNWDCWYDHHYRYESFPRLWDEPQVLRYGYWCTRIIPTPVGWTQGYWWNSSSTSNHSHACGMNPINSTHHNVNNTIYCGFSVLGILNCIFLTPERFRLEFLICNHVIPNACR